MRKYSDSNSIDELCRSKQEEDEQSDQNFYARRNRGYYDDNSSSFLGEDDDDNPQSKPMSDEEAKSFLKFSGWVILVSSIVIILCDAMDRR